MGIDIRMIVDDDVAESGAVARGRGAAFIAREDSRWLAAGPGGVGGPGVDRAVGVDRDRAAGALRERSRLIVGIEAGAAGGARVPGRGRDRNGSRALRAGLDRVLRRARDGLAGPGGDGDIAVAGREGKNRVRTASDVATLADGDVHGVRRVEVFGQDAVRPRAGSRHVTPAVDRDAPGPSAPPGRRFSATIVSHRL